MSHQGKVQYTSVLIVPPELVDDVERMFESHASWMEETHHREGDRALLLYNVARAPERSNPLDPESDLTGRTCFFLTEVYETEAGIADHLRQADESWVDYEAAQELLSRCRVVGATSAEIVHSLW